MEPIRLQPLYQPRVWGGRELERLYHRPLPADGQPYGEAWEVVDRPEAQSIVLSGEYAGWTLHQLWTERRAEIFGPEAPDTERFPLLLKILDAREDLSLQVHPPAELAGELGGEPKTEMWVVADATPTASLVVGVKPGVDQEQFSQALQAGTVADLVPRLAVEAGNFIFIPSGRLHAIGGGLVIFEIQQNSDTTYRVFDWNRLGLDGKPRELHVAESLRCIDFTDTAATVEAPRTGTLVQCAYFHVAKRVITGAAPVAVNGQFTILIALEGEGTLANSKIAPGDHLLLPHQAQAGGWNLETNGRMELLEVAFQ